MRKVLKNIKRIVSRTPFLEKVIVLLLKTKIKLFYSFVPPHTMYQKGAGRIFIRKNIHFNLDVSELISWAWYFRYEEKWLLNMTSFMKPGDVIFDIGANIGTTSLYISKNTPCSKIYSFEPDEINYNKFKYHIGLNKVENIHLAKIGIGDEPGIKRLFRVSENNPGMNKIIDEGLTDSASEFSEIEIQRLDDFVRDFGIEKVNFVKIDVEGYELKVLNGAKETLRKYLPIICLEVVDSLLITQNTSAADVLGFIKTLGYNKFLDAHSLEEITEIKNDFSCDIICLAIN